MKHFLIFTTIVAFCKVESFSRDFNKNALQKTFGNISQALAQRNHLTSVVTESAFSGAATVTAGILHVVARFKNNSERFPLNSSAIVFLDSVASLEAFNTRTTLPTTFSTTQQLFIHCRNGSQDEIAMLAKTKKQRKSWNTSTSWSKMRSPFGYWLSSFSHQLNVMCHS